MSLRHLTDEEIQEYLDGNLSQQKTFLVKRHLETCPICQESVKRYQSLYAGLASDEGFDLPYDFAKSVVSRLPVEAHVKSHFNFANIFLAVSGIIVALSIAVRYLDLKPLGQTISNILSAQYEFVLGVAESLKTFLSGLNTNRGLLIFGVLALLVIVTLDHFLVRKFLRVER
jgi:hypothetical protein